MASRSGLTLPEIKPKDSVVKRKRASTRQLLGTGYKDEVKLSDIPPAAKRTSTYNISTLRKRLYWVDCVLRDSSRKISPIRGYQLTAYKNACADALASELAIEEGKIPPDKIEQRRTAWAAGLRVFEKSNEYVLCLQQINSKGPDELQEKTLELLTEFIYARYGDLLTSACKLLKCKPQQMDPPGAQLLRGFWTDIDLKLEKEKEAFAKVRRTGVYHEGDCPMHFSIQATCVVTGFKLEHIVNLLHVYTMRNQRIHNNLLLLIRAGKTATLAKTLQEDLNDLPKVIPRERGTEIQVLQQLLVSMIDLWFNKKVGREDNYERWTESDALTELMDKVEHADPHEEAGVWKNAAEQVTEALAERLQREKTDESMADMVQGDALLTASSEPETETRGVKRAMDLWRCLSDSVQKLHNLARVYKDEFDELCARPDGGIHVQPQV